MSDATTRTSGEYVVVARRYRPQAFDALIGQEHVAKALTGAIASDRVGHAYLFTGARGVGKTSAARILAKALNCIHGPAPAPCNECEICQSVSSGDDVDVLEIDGASNRGIDEIRQLRQNVAVRPSRARFKIYIIDEVHMLTKEAFNALLKTLEEPPEHVKFIFATTEPNKIPITILSRCQRYDFAGIDAASIRDRLAEIARDEGVEAERDALEIIATRAAGSMRDSQSLLEQLLSSGARSITAADVTSLLGLAPAARLSRIIEPLVTRDAAAALAELDAAIHEGAEVGQLVDQLLGYFRDALTQAVGCDASRMLYALPGQRAEVRGVAERLGVETLLAIAQVLDQSAARMRISTQVRTLAEMAVVRICQLENLAELSTLIERLRGSSIVGSASTPAVSNTLSAQTGAKKNALNSPPRPHMLDEPPMANEPATASIAQALDGDVGSAPAARSGTRPTGSTAASAATEPPRVDDAQVLWKLVLKALAGTVFDYASAARCCELSSDGRLIVKFPATPEGRFARDGCQRPATLSKLESALTEAAGGRLGLVLVLDDASEDARGAEIIAPKATAKQQQVAALAAPFVQRGVELFAADATRIRYVPPIDES